MAFSAQHIQSIHKILLNLKINIQNIHNIQIHPCSMFLSMLCLFFKRENRIHFTLTYVTQSIKHSNVRTSNVFWNSFNFGENLYLVKFRLPHHCYDINMSIFSCMNFMHSDILTVWAKQYIPFEQWARSTQTENERWFQNANVSLVIL